MDPCRYAGRGAQHRLGRQVFEITDVVAGDRDHLVKAEWSKAAVPVSAGIDLVYEFRQSRTAFGVSEQLHDENRTSLDRR